MEKGEIAIKCVMELQDTLSNLGKLSYYETQEILGYVTGIVDICCQLITSEENR